MTLLHFMLLLFHPLHVSVCEMNFNANSNKFEFSQRIFLDDLELALNKQNNLRLDLTHTSATDQIDSVLNDYLKDKVILKVDGKTIPLKYLGHEVQEGVYWMYLESIAIANHFDEIQLKNDVLFELYDDQSTIIQLNNEEKSKNFRLSRDKVEVSITDF